MTPVFVIKINDELCWCVLFDMMCKEKLTRSCTFKVFQVYFYDTDAR